MNQPEPNYKLRPLFSFSGPVWMLHMAVQYPDMPIVELTDLYCKQPGENWIEYHERIAKENEIGLFQPYRDDR